MARHYPGRFMSARSKRRHPCEKGDPTVRSLLFPEQPVGPFCYVRQEKHAEPYAKRDRDRRKERRFRRDQRNAALDEGDVRCTHIDE